MEFETNSSVLVGKTIGRGIEGLRLGLQRLNQKLDSRADAPVTAQRLESLEGKIDALAEKLDALLGLKAEAKAPSKPPGGSTRLPRDG